MNMIKNNIKEIFFILGIGLLFSGLLLKSLILALIATGSIFIFFSLIGILKDK